MADELVLRGDEFLDVEGDLSTGEACCCEVPCEDLDFTVVTSSVAYVGVGTCGIDVCGNGTTEDGFLGATSWVVGWADLPALAGATYKLWRKAGLGGDCGACTSADGYTLYGTYTEPQAALTIYRGETTGCNVANFQCWLLEVIPASGPHVFCCATSPADSVRCQPCGCTVHITGSAGPCVGSGSGVVDSVSASFTLSVSPEGCVEALGGSPTWTMFANGVEIGSGVGVSGTGSGSGISCSCPDAIYPCGGAVTIGVSVIGEFISCYSEIQV